MPRSTISRASLSLALLAAGLAACDSAPSTSADAAAPTVDAARLNAGLAAVSRAQATPVWQSFRALSPAIGASTGSAAARIITDARWTADVTPSVAQAAARARSRLAAVAETATELAPDSKAIAVLPPHLLGATFVWDETAQQYVRDPVRTDAPVNGVRHVIYPVNPFTGRPASAEELGYVDFTDEGAELLDGLAVRLRVVAVGITYLDYAFSLTGAPAVRLVRVQGFLSSGNDRVEFRIDGGMHAGGAAAFGYRLEVPAHSFLAEATIQAHDQRSRVEERITAGPDGITFIATHEGDGVEAVVAVNGIPFATIRGLAVLPEIRRADGAPLSSEEASALRGILELTGRTLGLFGDLLGPVGGVH